MDILCNKINPVALSQLFDERLGVHEWDDLILYTVAIVFTVTKGKLKREIQLILCHAEMPDTILLTQPIYTYLFPSDFTVTDENWSLWYPFDFHSQQEAMAFMPLLKEEIYVISDEVSRGFHAKSRT